MKKQIAIDDETLAFITSARHKPELITSRSTLEPFLDKVFFIQGVSTGITKSIRGTPHLLIKEVSAVLLTTSGVLERISHLRTFHFEHVWLPFLKSINFLEGSCVRATMPACRYERQDGTHSFGFRLSDTSNPADVFEMNFRYGLALLDLNLRLTQTSLELDPETVRVLLRANIEALVNSTNLLESLYQTKKLEECRASRNLISFLTIWLESLERPKIATSPKKGKAKAKGFARG